MKRFVAHHIRHHWHHHLAGASLTLAVAAFIAGATASTFIARGGWIPTKESHPIHVYGAGPLPLYASLERYLVRTHDQGNGNSCVGQTLATMGEIFTHEYGHPTALSSGFIYGQINGGIDQGSSYQDAFRVATSQGDAQLSAFPHDGLDWWALPTQSDRIDASHHKLARWRWVSADDPVTIQYELSHRRPLAMAMAWRDTMVNHFSDCSPILENTGAYHFDHSTTVVGYRWAPEGLELLVQNSWGPSWGCNGRAWVLLSAIQQTGAAFAVADPTLPPPATKPPPFNSRLWWKYAASHHFSPRTRQKLAFSGPLTPHSSHLKPPLSWPAVLWYMHANGKGAGPVISPPQWFGPARGRRVGFLTQRFATARLYIWPGYSTHTRWVFKWIQVHTIT